MEVKTIIQTINTTPYNTIAELNFIWEPTKSGEITIDDKKVVVNEIIEKIDTSSGVLIRRVRLYILEH